MAKDCSFDVVSEVDMQEVDNAVNQAKKEIGTRYDFRGSKAEILITANLNQQQVQQFVKSLLLKKALLKKMLKK